MQSCNRFWESLSLLPGNRVSWCKMADEDDVPSGLGLVPPFQEWSYGTSYRHIRLPTIQLRRISPKSNFLTHKCSHFTTLHTKGDIIIIIITIIILSYNRKCCICNTVAFHAGPHVTPPYPRWWNPTFFRALQDCVRSLYIHRMCGYSKGKSFYCGLFQLSDNY